MGEGGGLGATTDGDAWGEGGSEATGPHPMRTTTSSEAGLQIEKNLARLFNPSSPHAHHVFVRAFPIPTKRAFADSSTDFGGVV